MRLDNNNKTGPIEESRGAIKSHNLKRKSETDEETMEV